MNSGACFLQAPLSVCLPCPYHPPWHDAATTMLPIRDCITRLLSNLAKYKYSFSREVLKLCEFDWFFVTSLTKALLSRSLGLARLPTLRRVLVFPTFCHSTNNPENTQSFVNSFILWSWSFPCHNFIPAEVYIEFFVLRGLVLVLTYLWAVEPYVWAVCLFKLCEVNSLCICGLQSNDRNIWHRKGLNYM